MGVWRGRVIAMLWADARVFRIEFYCIISWCLPVVLITPLDWWKQNNSFWPKWHETAYELPLTVAAHACSVSSPWTPQFSTFPTPSFPNHYLVLWVNWFLSVTIYSSLCPLLNLTFIWQLLYSAFTCAWVVYLSVSFPGLQAPCCRS